MDRLEHEPKREQSKTVRRGLAVLLVLAAVASLAFARPLSYTGPIASLCNVPAIGTKPGELNCTLCHYSDFGPNLDQPGGKVEILDLPATYDAGQTYTLRVRLQSDSTAAFPGRRWGFQCTAVNSADGEGVGTFVLPDPDTLKIINGSGSFASRRYVEHQFPGIRQGLAGPVEWSFSWRAPDPATGSVYFFVSGNAGDGNDEPRGDFIYTASDTVLDATSPTRNVTWGAIKARYR